MLAAKGPCESCVPLEMVKETLELFFSSTTTDLILRRLSEKASLGKIKNQIDLRSFREYMKDIVGVTCSEIVASLLTAKLRK